MKLLENSDEFTDVLLIQQARVPIVKFVLMGIQFDVLFAAIEDPKRLGNLLKKLTNQGASNAEGFKDLSETTQSSLCNPFSFGGLIFGNPVFMERLHARTSLGVFQTKVHSKSL